MRYTHQFIAVFDKEDKGFNICFPDLEGCTTSALSFAEVPTAATEVLELFLYGLEEDQAAIPPASTIDQIKLGPGELPLLVSVNTQIVREEQENRKVKKTLTLPAWLNTKAEMAGINFSKTLQDALLQKLV